MNRDIILPRFSKSTLDLIHDLIRQYGTFNDDGISAWLHKFDYSDKKLLMSHLLDMGDYEYACEDIYKFEAVYKENYKYMQYALDSECDQVLYDHNEDMKNNSSIESGEWERAYGEHC